MSDLDIAKIEIYLNKKEFGSIHNYEVFCTNLKQFEKNNFLEGYICLGISHNPELSIMPVMFSRA
ncbi:MAG: hypothetical protein K8S13_04420 [Desulfobacula sp.]|uniref:hypothetical protein n=1 Tax=Desulfobacula sp. TaxID=2593537 RepID=UPI0025C55BEC|nr:hypothetical protein [Desulfobacula sp.]MCD4719089.1 hypothetical protein [Desulfobacula sp.]